MMNWDGHFDKIFLINLPHRVDRLAAASSELLSKGITDFTVFPATNDDNGAKGLWITLKEIFRISIAEKYDRILVFEDDVKFINDPNYYLEWMIDQLLETDPEWEMFYLGANTHKSLYKANHNILIAEQCRALHAVAYQADGIRRASEFMNFFHPAFPADVVMEAKMQPGGHCYCAYPMLCTQTEGFSNIMGRKVSNEYIAERFLENTKHLPE